MRLQCGDARRVMPVAVAVMRRAVARAAAAGAGCCGRATRRLRKSSRSVSRARAVRRDAQLFGGAFCRLSHKVVKPYQVAPITSQPFDDTKTISRGSARRPRGPSA